MAKKKAVKSPKTNSVGKGKVPVGTTVPTRVGAQLHELARNQDPPMTRTAYIRDILIQAAARKWKRTITFAEPIAEADDSLGKEKDSAA